MPECKRDKKILLISIMDSTQILSISGLVISVAGAVYAGLNHKRVRSHCCGRDIVASLDVEDTTPQGAVKIQAPPAAEK